MSDEQIDFAALVAAEANATPAPWHVDEDGLNWGVYSGPYLFLGGEVEAEFSLPRTEADADFIVAARNALPVLLAQREAVLALHPVIKYEIQEHYTVQPIQHEGCPTCESDGPCDTRRALDGAE
jgi:hypothetical protein